MKRQTSLGDFISALYDTVDAAGDRPASSQVVAACTLEVLWRQRRRSLIAALMDAPDATIH